MFIMWSYFLIASWIWICNIWKMFSIFVKVENVFISIWLVFHWPHKIFSLSCIICHIKYQKIRFLKTNKKKIKIYTKRFPPKQLSTKDIVFHGRLAIFPCQNAKSSAHLMNINSLLSFNSVGRQGWKKELVNSYAQE